MTKPTKKGKNKRKSVEYDGYEFDSTEERDFYCWLMECVDNGLVEPDLAYQPCTFNLTEKVTVEVTEQLKTKVNTKEKHLLAAHVYSPDFKIRFTQKMIDMIGGKFTPCTLDGFKFIDSGSDVYIDVKGTHNPTARSFSIDQKIMHRDYGIYIHKIVPIKLFKATWCPDNDLIRLTPKKKEPRKNYWDLPYITDFMQV